jgi:hypothetical protein
MNIFRKKLIEGLVIKITVEMEMADVEGYTTPEDVEQDILSHALDLGYSYETDEKRNEYCLKATQSEIWQYWLKEIIPTIK